jgi:hypothetical protein
MRSHYVVCLGSGHCVADEARPTWSLISTPAHVSLSSTSNRYPVIQQAAQMHCGALVACTVCVRSFLNKHVKIEACRCGRDTPPFDHRRSFPTPPQLAIQQYSRMEYGGATDTLLNHRNIRAGVTSWWTVEQALHVLSTDVHRSAAEGCGGGVIAYMLIQRAKEIEVT